MPKVKESTSALELLVQDRLNHKKIGASFDFEEYKVADGIQFPSSFNRIDHPEFAENILQLEQVLAICEKIGLNILRLFPRDNGPEQVNSHFHHGFRTANIVINEFGVIDPLVVATTYLHDLYQVVIKTLPIADLTPDQRRTTAREYVRNIIHQYFQQNEVPALDISFQKQLLANLEDLFVLEQSYEDLAQRMVQNEPLLQPYKEGQIASPSEFLSLRKELINKYVLNHSPEGKFMNLEEIFRFGLDQLQPQNTLGEQTLTSNRSGVAVILALIAEAIDNQRYPSNTQTHESQLKNALVSHFFHTVMARAFQLPTAVRDLGEQVNQVFFGDVWKSFKTALDEIGDQHPQNWFNLQERMSAIRLHHEISDLLSESKAEASYVSPAEFESRRVQSSLQPDDFYLGDWEYTIASDIKTPASIFAKWVVDQSRDRLVPNLSIDSNQEFDTEYWKKYLSGAPDILRANVVLGRKLARHLLDVGAIEKFGQNLSYLDENTTDSSKPINYFQPSRSEDSNRLAGESWRVEPLLEDEQIFFEYHLCLLLTNPDLLQKDLLPFEVHFESIDQWYQDTFGLQLHQLYKNRDLLPAIPAAWSEHHHIYLVGLFQLIQKELDEVYYNGLSKI